MEKLNKYINKQLESPHTGIYFGIVGGSASASGGNQSTAADNAMTAGGVSTAWSALVSVNDWNGSAWSAGTALPTSQGIDMFRGNTDSGICVGGFTGTNLSPLTLCRTWDGSAWTTKASAPTPKFAGFGLGGSEDSAFATAGQNGSGGTQLFGAEEYDGSANTWTTKTSCTYGGQGSMGDGNPNEYVNAGNRDTGGTGSAGRIETWDGSSWTVLAASANYTLGTNYNYGCACGVSNDSFMMGTNSLSTGTGLIYKFNGSTWTDSGSAAIAPKYIGMGGDSSSAIMAGGWYSGAPFLMFPPSAIYDGTTWSTTSNLQTSRGANGMGATT
jgi:hypothetical protein